jgi:hypothetical protein
MSVIEHLDVRWLSGNQVVHHVRALAPLCAAQREFSLVGGHDQDSTRLAHAVQSRPLDRPRLPDYH